MLVVDLGQPIGGNPQRCIGQQLGPDEVEALHTGGKRTRQLRIAHQSLPLRVRQLGPHHQRPRHRVVVERARWPQRVHPNPRRG